MNVFRCVAPITVFAGGVLSISGVAPSVSLVFALIGLCCYARNAARREAMSWGLILLASAIALYQGDIELIATGAASGLIYGSMMIAISTVQVPARHSIVANAVSRRLSKRTGLTDSWTEHLFANAAGAALSLSGLLILQAAVREAAVDSRRRLEAAVVYLRGFSTAPVWSPYSYFAPLMIAAFPMLTLGQLASIGLVLTVLIIGLSTYTPPLALSNYPTRDRDKTSTSGSTTDNLPAPGRLRSQMRWAAFLVFFASIAALMGFSDLNPTAVAVIGVPTLGVCWGCAESLIEKRPVAFITDISHHFVKNVPDLRTELLALTAAGFFSTVLAHQALPSSLIAANVGIGIVGAETQACGLFFLILVLTVTGLNPIVFVAPLAALAQSQVEGAISPMVAITILCCAWGLFPLISPFAAANLVTARGLGVSAGQLVLTANARFNVLAIVSCLLLVMAVTAFDVIS